MRKLLIPAVLIVPLSLLLYVWFGDALRYSDEIQMAYDYVDARSRETIQNEKLANVTSYTPASDFKLWDKKTDAMVNMKGQEPIQVTFKTNDEHGDIHVYLDRNANKVIGVALRK